MNYLIIAADSPKQSKGGIERYVSNFIRYAKGKEDKYFFLFANAAVDEVEVFGNVTVESRALINKSYKLDKSNSSRGDTRIRLRSFYDFLDRYIVENKIALVCAENFHFSASPGYAMMLNMVCQAKAVPLLINLHSFPTRDIHEAIVRDLLWDKVVCVSNSVAGDCFAKGVDPNLIVTNHLGVDTSVFNNELDKKALRRNLGFNDDDFIILHASRILSGVRDVIQEKGFAYLIEAVSRLARTEERVKILFAIALPPQRLEEEYRQAIEKLNGYIKVYNLQDRVVIKNYELEEMPMVYAGANLFVLASENETFGQVIVEAMACGTPVVATSVGGILEIVTNGQNGFLVHSKDVSSLEGRIKDLVVDEDLRARFKKAGLETVGTRFNADKKFGDLVEIFRNCVDSVHE